MDRDDRVLGHAAKADEARAIDGRYVSGENCLDVLKRLVPEFSNAQWSQSGCADDDRQSNVVVYWGVVMVR
jgi:hypothetical protein